MAATTAEVTTPTVPEPPDAPAVTAAVRSWADIASAKDEPRAREDASDARAPSDARHAVDPAIDLPEATRVILVKADGSVLIHSDGGSYKPLNWMSPPCHT